MNTLAWLLYLKTLAFLVQPMMGMQELLCGSMLADTMAVVCEGRGYNYLDGSSDSPLLNERQAKTFTKSGRERTGQIVTECCHNPCDMRIMESYCAPVKEGQVKYTETNLDFVNEANNVVEETPVRVPQQVGENTIVEGTVPYVSQDIVVDTTSDEFDWDSDVLETHNILNGGGNMYINDQPPPDTSESDDELIPEDNSFVKPLNITESHTDEIDEDTDSENSESKMSIGTTKGNSRTKPTHRPASRNSERKNNREKKKNKTKTKSREKKRRNKNKPKKNKNQHDRRNKGKRHGGDRDDSTQPTDEFITEIEAQHPRIQAVAGMPSSRSEPANIDDPTDPGTRSERSHVTTIHARLDSFGRRR